MDYLTDSTLLRCRSFLPTCINQSIVFVLSLQSVCQSVPFVYRYSFARFVVDDDTCMDGQVPKKPARVLRNEKLWRHDYQPQAEEDTIRFDRDAATSKEAPDFFHIEGVPRARLNPYGGYDFDYDHGTFGRKKTNFRQKYVTSVRPSAPPCMHACMHVCRKINRRRTHARKHARTVSCTCPVLQLER